MSSQHEFKSAENHSRFCRTSLQRNIEAPGPLPVYDHCLDRAWRTVAETMVDCRRCICGHERALDEESLIQAIAEMKLNGSPEHKLHHDISDGEALHRLVPPDRWCVTREDFSHLHQLILDALEAGWVAPSAADPFDKSDGTVACQYRLSAFFSAGSTKHRLSTRCPRVKLVFGPCLPQDWSQHLYLDRPAHKAHNTGCWWHELVFDEASWWACMRRLRHARLAGTSRAKKGLVQLCSLTKVAQVLCSLGNGW